MKPATPSHYSLSTPDRHLPDLPIRPKSPAFPSDIFDLPNVSRPHPSVIHTVAGAPCGAPAGLSPGPLAAST